MREPVKTIVYACPHVPVDAARVFWVNPVADLQVMNLVDECGLPALEIEVPSITDATRAALRTRLEALVEIVRNRRDK
jgi:hypothetical protein